MSNFLSVKRVGVIGLLAGAAAVAGFSTESYKLAASNKAIDNNCKQLSGLTDDQALKCVSTTWNHAVLVARQVDKNTIASDEMRAACQDKALPNAKMIEGLTVGLRKDTEACFDAIDKSLGVAVQTQTDHYKDVSIQARYATQRAHAFLPYKVQ